MRIVNLKNPSYHCRRQARNNQEKRKRGALLWRRTRFVLEFRPASRTSPGSGCATSGKRSTDGTTTRCGTSTTSIPSSCPTGPCMESWTLLGALSQHTKRARIGALVNGNTYRNPALTAKMAATLDQICGGRLNLGLGAGWFELEHKSLGFDFKTVPQRLEALDESCQIIKGMFTQDKTTLRGKHYNIVDAVCNPKPIQQNVPLMIGGHG